MNQMNTDRKAYYTILHENGALRTVLTELGQTLAERSLAMCEVIKHFTALKERLDSHFATEEGSDCFEEMVSHAPRVSDRVAALVAEHREFQTELSQIMEWLQQTSGSRQDWEQITARFGTFRERLTAHENKENLLLQEVFTDDIGSKD